MKKLREMKKNQKGFTLVEVIVVLVILAIMAAILIPSLIGYIDKAKENTIVSETRSIVTAVQAVASEQYGYHKDATKVEVKAGDTKYTPAGSGSTGGTITVGLNEVMKLSEVKGLDESNVIVEFNGTLDGTTVAKAKISKLTYKTGGKQCVYPDYKVTDAE